MEEKYNENKELICPLTGEICLYYIDLFPEEEPEFCVNQCTLYHTKCR